MNDPDQRFHETWLGMLQPVNGLVVSVPVLVEAQCAERLVSDAQARLRASCSVDDDGEVRSADTNRIVHELLGYPAHAVRTDGMDTFALFVPEGPQAITPTAVLCDPERPDSPLLLLWRLPDGLELDRPETITGAFDYPPTAKFDRLLRHAGVPVGLLTNGQAFRLVYAPAGEGTGSLTFHVEDMLSVGGRPILDAFVMLLSAHRVYGVAPERSLHRLLEDSRRWQARVSDRLAEQVREAAALLLQGFEEAEQRDGNTALAELAADDGDAVHRGVLTALLRIVFLLYAEDAGLMPAEHEAYRSGLSIVGLYERLREDAGTYPDSMDQRFGAWGQVLTAFRAVYFGVAAGDLPLPPRRGTLFDPHRFPFLEGWITGSSPVADPVARAAVAVPTVSDAVVRAVLDRLIILEGQRISYRSLDVEQIGSVYERMLGYTVVRVAGDAVWVRGGRRWLMVDELAEVPAARRRAWLKDELELASAAADRVARTFSAASSDAARREALIVAAAKDGQGRPLVRGHGALVLQPKASLESSTSHYTPRELCQPLVARAIEPLLHALGDQPSSEQLLSLKICDPAMGSGAFLVEACRYLGDAVAAAWKRDPSSLPANLGSDDPVIVARRLVAQRCLYGIDRNADAVELAKLSLWLVTLARDLPFTFVDHALRHGDSIVGLGLDEIARFHWKDAQEDLFVRGEVAAALAEALPLRTRIEDLASAHTPEEQAAKEQLLWDAEDAIERLRVTGDLVLAAFFGGATVAEREALRCRYRDAVVAWLRDDVALPADVAEARRSFRQAVPAFHWSLEFPEIFQHGRADPLERGTFDARMDAFVGNMPFIGGRRIATIHGERYASWLVDAYDATGEVDYFVYFFLRASALLGANGTIGLIPKSSITEGDTRRVGLQRLLGENLQIYDARRRMPWPGDANALVSPVSLAKGMMRDHTDAPRLDGVAAPQINSRLRTYEERPDSPKLEDNRGCAFVGCFLRGEGFVLSREEATALLAEDRRLGAVIRPYLVGEDITKDVRQSPSRFVVDFGVLELDAARAFGKAMKVVEERVRGEREKLRATGADASHRRFWWRFANTRNELRAWLAENDSCFVLPRVAKHLLVARANTDQVFSEQVVVFGLRHVSAFGILQSRIHEVWVRILTSTHGEGLRYSASDCFDTFPFPERNPRTELPQLAASASRLETLRAQYMVDESVGLTTTYNRLTDPAVNDARVLALRRAHEDLDAAVFEAYERADPGGRWSEVSVPPFCGGTAAHVAALERFETTVYDRLYALNLARTRRSDEIARAPGPKRTRAKTTRRTRVNSGASEDE